MKKVIYFFALFAFLASAAHAQIFSQDFENYQQVNFSGQWGSVGNSGSQPWQCDVPYIVGGPCFPATGNSTIAAGISDFFTPPGTGCSFDHNDSNVLLFTPLIHLNNAQHPFFKYDSWFSKKMVNNVSESATIEISTDSGSTWTVLQNAPVNTAAGMITSYVDLSAYAAYPSIRMGFRYGDNGQHMIGWIIDNLQVFSPVQHDLALGQLYPADSFMRYVKVGDSAVVSGLIENRGSQAVTAFTINYQYGNGAVYTQTISGVSIAPFTAYGFQHSQRFAISAPIRYDLKVWVSMPGDQLSANDSGKIAFTGASFIPEKVVAIEHGTGTWYPFAPQGYGFMDRLSKGDNPPVIVAAHDQDPMESDLNYGTYLENLNHYYVPYFLFDRSKSVDATIVVVRPSGIFKVFDSTLFYNQYNISKQRFGFAKIDLNPGAYDYKINVAATITPAVDLHGDYRLALVLTEDKLQGTSSQWAQQNAYAGGNFGPMYGYENLPDPVPASAMTYNFVARSINPDPRGAQGCLPSDMTHNNTYTCQLTAPIVSPWKAKNMRAIVLLMHYDGSDSSVLNAAQLPIPTVGITDVSNRINDFRIYPNPADSRATLMFDLVQKQDVSVSVNDLAGRLLFRNEYPGSSSGSHEVVLPTAHLASGLYYVTIQTSEGQQALKLQVIH